MIYVRLPDGTVVDDPPRPTQAWTPDEWTAEIKAREDKLAELQAAQQQTKTVPDQECLDFWNSMIPQPPEQIGLLEAELAEMKAV